MPKLRLQSPEVLTVEEVRARLRLSRNAVYDAIARKEIPALKFGRRILVPRAALERMLTAEVPSKAV